MSKITGVSGCSIYKSKFNLTWKIIKINPTMNYMKLEIVHFKVNGIDYDSIHGVSIISIVNSLTFT